MEGFKEKCHCKACKTIINVATVWGTKPDDHLYTKKHNANLKIWFTNNVTEYHIYVVFLESNQYVYKFFFQNWTLTKIYSTYRKWNPEYHLDSIQDDDLKQNITIKFNEVKEKNFSIRQIEIYFAHFIIMHNISFTSTKDIVDLVKNFSNKPEVLAVNLDQNKINNLINEVISPIFKEFILHEIKDESFSLTVDGYSKKNLKLLGVMISYYSPSLQIPV